MTKIAYKHKCETLKPILQVSTVVDKLGDIWYSVEYQDNDTKVCQCRFKKMTSVIDFISSNFK